MTGLVGADGCGAGLLPWTTASSIFMALLKLYLLTNSLNAMHTIYAAMDLVFTVDLRGGCFTGVFMP